MGRYLCEAWQGVRFVAKDGKKYDLLPAIVKDGKKYDLLPAVCALLSKMGRSMIYCHPCVLDSQRWGEVRFVAANWCLIPWALNPEF